MVPDSFLVTGSATKEKESDAQCTESLTFNQNVTLAVSLGNVSYAAPVLNVASNSWPPVLNGPWSGFGQKKRGEGGHNTNTSKRPPIGRHLIAQKIFSGTPIL